MPVILFCAWPDDVEMVDIRSDDHFV